MSVNEVNTCISLKPLFLCSQIFSKHAWESGRLETLTLSTQ